MDLFKDKKIILPILLIVAILIVIVGTYTGRATGTVTSILGGKCDTSYVTGYPPRTMTYVCGGCLACENKLCKREIGCPCALTADCRSGLTCNMGKCKAGLNGPTTGACDINRNDQCLPSLVCINGKCQKPLLLGGSCVLTSQCSSGLLCVDTKCKAQLNGKCSINTDCVKSLVCEGSKCKGDVGAICNNLNTNCISGLLCVNNYCQSSITTTTPPGGILQPPLGCGVVILKDGNIWLSDYGTNPNYNTHGELFCWKKFDKSCLFSEVDGNIVSCVTKFTEVPHTNPVRIVVTCCNK